MARTLNAQEKRIYNKAAAINARLKSIKMHTFLNDFEKALVDESDFMKQIGNVRTNWTGLLTANKNIKRVYSKGVNLNDVEAVLDSLMTLDSPVKSLNAQIKQITKTKSMKQYRQRIASIPNVIKGLTNLVYDTSNQVQEYKYFAGDDYSEMIGDLWAEYKNTGKQSYLDLIHMFGAEKA